MTQRQTAAIPFRMNERGKISILLITSRTRKRWIIPKGKIGGRLLPSRSAEREAFEEAGVIGAISKEAVGVYRQGDELHPGAGGGTEIVAYALHVAGELPVWREADQRARRWFTLKSAMRAVRDPELRFLFRSFKRWVKASM
jgi:ADP-ribose pyrophosphatase YjhB (NUDIX family)